ncbi:hypothetical protein ACFLZ0_00580 [Patescibacteria group bacterium]
MFKFQENFKLNIIDITVSSVYYIFVCFSFLSLFGFFSRFLVYLILIILLLFLFIVRRYIVFNRKYLWLFLLTPLAISGFGFLRGFFSGDSYWIYLPVAKDIIINGRMPNFLVGYYLSAMPLLSLLFAGTFSIFNSFNELLCLWVPFFFAAATIVVLFQWANDKKIDKRFLFFIPILFLTNSGVAFWGGWNLLQESILLFFASTFFYYYEKYLNHHKEKDLIFLFSSFVLAIASKLIGLFLILLLLLLLFKDKNKKRFLKWLFFISVPILFWFFRNYLVYGSPIFPMFNSLLSSPYSFALQKSYFPGYIYTDRGFLAIFIGVIKQLWLGFPFILLSFYGFFKKRHYEYIFLFILFFFMKEILYFTTTVSSIRYYYLFFGLFLVYALLGLQEIRSKWLITILVLLAIVGLLLVPVTNSTSVFISLFENRFSLLGQIFNLFHKYWYLTLIVLAPFVYHASQKKKIDIFLIFLYCFYILHLQFVANKSWLNTWPFIFLSLLFLILFSIKKKFRFFKQIVVAIIIFVVFFNSWAMAAIYYWHQGGITLPVPFIWENSYWAHQVLNEKVEIVERTNFYILVAGQPSYFYWKSNYKPINLFDFDFNVLVSEYGVGLSDLELYQLFSQKKIKYIVKNLLNKCRYGDPSNSEFEQLFNKIGNSKYFELIDSKDGKYFIWKVY